MMKRTKKIAKKLTGLMAVTVLAGALITPVPVQAAEWHRNGAGWWWQEQDGSYPVSDWKKINGKWYHFNQAGYMDNGWYKDGSKWYYLGGENDGAMKTGWNKVGAKWYYLGEENDGAMKTGWCKVGTTWYYLGGENDGAMKTGWYQEGTKWYYLGDINDGAMKTGWQEIDGKYYYFNSDGSMARNTTVDGYKIGADGVRGEKQGTDNNDKVYTIDLGNGQTATVEGHFDTEYAAQVVELVNQYRIENGLEPLTVMTDLSDAAFFRSYETAYQFSHMRPNGESCFSVVPFGTIYYGVAENIAAGQATPEVVMKTWKNSAGHNENMLGNYNCIGVGCFITKGTNSYGQYRYYWVQIFGWK